MIAEVLLVLAGHPSSLFPENHTIHPSFSPLLHPGEQQCIESLGLIAFRYRTIKSLCAQLQSSSSRYISAVCASINHILKDDYEALVISTEERVLRRDATLVASGSFVPLSSIRATFAEWDAPLLALVSLVEELRTRQEIPPGPLIDLLLERAKTGVHRIAEIFTQLSHAVERVWRVQLIAFLIHGSVSKMNPLVSDTYTFLDGSLPSCITSQSRDSIIYVGRAISTVKAAKWQKQLPTDLAIEHANALESVMPDDQPNFDRVISQIRTSVSEWLWMNVLTLQAVEEAVDSFANYFLLRNGEFGLSLIREIERLKISRLTVRSGSPSMIREQDLNLVLLRASLGTTAQQDPALSCLRFLLPSGPIRPLLPSLGGGVLANSLSQSIGKQLDSSLFTSTLLGTPLVLTYTVTWPLDLFVHPAELSSYGALFSYLSALRKTHNSIHTCWSSLSNTQRARRRWTGLGEGGTAGDLEARKELLRCGWGVVRDMSWFLDTLMGYVMIDVVDVEYRRMKKQLMSHSGEEEHTKRLGSISTLPSSTSTLNSTPVKHSMPTSRSAASHIGGPTSSLDFTTLRQMHATYLDRLLTGCLLTNLEVTSTLASIFEVCERFVAQVERWGGDILPALLFEGSLKGGDGEEVGALVKERRAVVVEINETLHELLMTFYEHLSSSIFQRPFASSSADASKSMALGGHTTFNMSRIPVTSSSKSRMTADKADIVDVRRHVERLMLRLDFNGGFSKFSWGRKDKDDDILGDL
ncbi:gamma-tubulin ring complex protein [Lentinula edodes]|uniref:gamma-tubulin ring complex protein n=1 Tax=Lentinula edodes TaxID=5353 RepID=UPI001E8E2B18|nr:gamma-tubulin ring complex protein [Lentinula edodes]KAH7880982.1 gamma-tubulin ring complex protein [Lentinula edodes]